jgi:hypothetical protein
MVTPTRIKPPSDACGAGMGNTRTYTPRKTSSPPDWRYLPVEVRHEPPDEAGTEPLEVGNPRTSGRGGGQVRFRRHRRKTKNNPARALRRVGRGGSNHILASLRCMSSGISHLHSIGYVFTAWPDEPGLAIPTV